MKSESQKRVSTGRGKKNLYLKRSIWMFPKIGVPQMDGENNGKPY